MNTTISGVSASTVSSGFGIWGLTIIIFIAIAISLFIAFKNFRKFIYGGFLIGATLLLGSLSHWIAKEKVSGNAFPFHFVIYGLGFVVSSVIIGHFISKIKWLKDIEEKNEELYYKKEIEEKGIK